jgi:PAS domain S-box-containing protein
MNYNLSHLPPASAFRRHTDIAEEGIVAIDRQQRIVLFNHAAEKIFGWSAGEIVGQHLDALIPERFLPAHRKDVDDFGNSPAAARLMGDRRPVVGSCKDGSEFPAEVSICKFQERGEFFYAAICAT